MPQFTDSEEARLRRLLSRLSDDDVDMLNQMSGSARNAYKAAGKTPVGYWARPAIEHLWNHPKAGTRDSWARQKVEEIRKRLRWASRPFS